MHCNVSFLKCDVHVVYTMLLIVSEGYMHVLILCVWLCRLSTEELRQVSHAFININYFPKESVSVYVFTNHACRLCSGSSCGAVTCAHFAISVISGGYGEMWSALPQA